MKNRLFNKNVILMNLISMVDSFCNLAFAVSLLMILAHIFGKEVIEPSVKLGWITLFIISTVGCILIPDRHALHEKYNKGECKCKK